MPEPQEPGCPAPPTSRKARQTWAASRSDAPSPVPLTAAIRAFAGALPSRVPSVAHLARRAGHLGLVGCSLSTLLSGAHVQGVSGGPKPRCLVLKPFRRQPSG